MHLLMALLENPSAISAIQACGGDAGRLNAALTHFMDEHMPVLPKEVDVDAQPALGFQRVIQRAILHVQNTGKKEVVGTNILISIFAEQDSHAAYFLSEDGVTRFDVVNYVSHGITLSGSENPWLSASGQIGEGQGDDDSDDEEHQSALSIFAVNLNEQAMAGKIDPLIGRADEVERTIQILCRRR